MFYLYILESIKTGTYYVGIAANIQKRLAQHNNGLVKSTKSKKPWKLIHNEIYDNQSEARKRESHIKSQKSRKAIEKIIKHF